LNIGILAPISVQEMVYLKAVQKITPMDVAALRNHRSKNVSDKIWGGFSPLSPPGSAYAVLTSATRQLCHWSGEFWTWTATSSFDRVTRNNRRFSKRRTQPACLEYINTIAGMQLDQTSYWDSWKLFGRLWRYHHESWI